MKEKVHENDKKAAKTPSKIYNAIKINYID
jgi:hypothetical protein